VRLRLRQCLGVPGCGGGEGRRRARHRGRP
jgi:hypothetical protein